jgi:hypothetical protein
MALQGEQLRYVKRFGRVRSGSIGKEVAVYSFGEVYNITRTLPGFQGQLRRLVQDLGATR